MPEQDHETGQLDEAKIVFGMILIADHQTPEIVQPSEEPFNFPTALEAAQRSTVLCHSFRFAALTMWRNHVCVELIEQFLIERITIVGLVSHQALRNIRYESLLQRLADQFHFSRASTLCAYGERKTVAVCNCHDLGALAALGLSHTEPPFLAGAKLPSTKASLRSSPPRSLRSCATASSTCSRTLERTQFWKRRCTVWYAPYRGGRSFQGAPVRRIHRIPFSVVRRSLQGRPRRSARTRSGGKMVLTICHCSSVRSISP